MVKKTKTTASKPNKSSKTLRQYLESVVSRAKNNKHSGEELSKDLDSELKRIEQRVGQTLDDINKEFEDSDSPNDDQRFHKKLDQTTRILTNEMVQLTAMYHRQKDIAAIRTFLNKQRDVIAESMGDSKKDGSEGAKSLDSEIDELHGLMRNERQRITKAAQKERLKFLISVSIGLVSLAIGLYALIYK